MKLEWSDGEEGAGYIVEFREVGDPNWYTANKHPIAPPCIHGKFFQFGSKNLNKFQKIYQYIIDSNSSVSFVHFSLKNSVKNLSHFFI